MEGDELTERGAVSMRGRKPRGKGLEEKAELTLRDAGGGEDD